MEDPENLFRSLILYLDEGASAEFQCNASIAQHVTESRREKYRGWLESQYGGSVDEDTIQVEAEVGREKALPLLLSLFYHGTDFDGCFSAEDLDLTFSSEKGGLDINGEGDAERLTTLLEKRHKTEVPPFRADEFVVLAAFLEVVSFNGPVQVDLIEYYGDDWMYEEADFGEIPDIYGLERYDSGIARGALPPPTFIEFVEDLSGRIAFLCHVAFAIDETDLFIKGVGSAARYWAVGKRQKDFLQAVIEMEMERKVHTSAGEVFEKIKKEKGWEG